MDKILSVIIPTYNMEKYLQNCLDSLLIKDGFESLDVLVINDGSKDKSSVIAHDYENRFPNVFRVIDKENGNYGSCINRGLKEANGKYVKILDADDSYITDNFEEFLSILSKVDSDLVISDYIKVSETNRILEECSYKLNDSRVMKLEEICSYRDFMKIQMHAVTYKLEMLKVMGYKQTEGISYTDQQWIFTPMLDVKTVWYFSKPVYRYLIGRQGQTINESSAIKYAKNIIPCLKDILKIYSGNISRISPPLKAYYQKAILIPLTKGVYVNLILDYSQTAQSLLIQFDDQLKCWSPEIYSIIGSKEISSFAGFRYIDYWRNHKNCHRGAIKFFSSLYVNLIKLKKSIAEKKGRNE